MYGIAEQIADIKKAVTTYGADYNRIFKDTGLTEMQVKYRLRRLGMMDILPVHISTRTSEEFKEKRDIAAERVRSNGYVYGRDWDDIE